MIRRAILIYGPTASGKSKLAMTIAGKLDGEIVNADAMQVYADLRILTSRPSDRDCRAVRHHLFGHVDGGFCHSAADWLIAADQATKAIRKAGRVPIIVGGSGLYMLALTEGLSAIPQIDAQTRRKARETVAAGYGYDRLLQTDPAAAARIGRFDRQRLARALEVAMATNMSLEEFHAGKQKLVAEPLSDWSGFVLTPPRPDLYRNIDARFATMIEHGVEAEVEKLSRRKLDPELPVMKAHGVPHLVAGLDGRLSLAEAKSLSCRDTRRYAKRQYSWMTNRMQRWTRLPEQNTEELSRILIRIYAETASIP